MTGPKPFGRYQLLERIGVGGMAELFLAAISGPSGFRKTVAIKRMLPEYREQQHYREMFLHEGRLMGALDHRNLVQVFELGEVDGELFICLEYVPGRSLAQVLRSHQERDTVLSPELAAWIGRELCQGLHYLHNLVDDRGQPLHVIHRDVNPHNILLSRHGDVKLGDLGIAKSLADAPQTQQGYIKGKLQYMAPEQARGEPLAPTTDVYASGLVIFEMLTGQRYLQGDTDAELLLSASLPRWRPIRPLNPETGTQLEQVVERALRVAPELRFASARALAAALDETIALSPRPPTADDLARLVRETPDDGATGELRTLDPASLVDLRSADSNAVLAAAPPAVPAGGKPTSTISLAVPSPHRARAGRPWWQLALAAAAPLAIAALVWSWWHANAPAWSGVADGGIASSAASGSRDGSETWTIDVVLPTGRDAAAPDAEDSAANAVWPDARAPIRHGRGPGKHSIIRRAPDGGSSQAGASSDPISTLQRELTALLARFRERGLRPGDAPQVDTLFLQVERSLRGRQAEPARLQLEQLATAIAAAVIDRALVERKMVRLQRILERAGRIEEFDDQRRRVLELALENRYEEANAALNRILDQLASR
ncbi:MAG: serine/threonine protein kinase [Deltaproteobacteria bacterium]|nr:serine/threonine protein kinase [Deltaproteobacteria bacterium]